MWHGNYTIASGVISPSCPLKEGQRFMIAGSDLNDGVYTYHAHAIMNDDDLQQAALQDEAFSGSICAMAIPAQFLALVENIKDWETKYGAVAASPYTSETVSGVYSYTKAQKSGDSGGASGYAWQDTFGPYLERWRKPCP